MAIRNTDTNPVSVFREIWGCRREWNWILFFSVLISILALTPTFFMLEVYGRVIPTHNMSTLGMLLVLALAAHALMEALDLTRLRVLHQFGQRLDDKLRSRVFDAIFDARPQKKPGSAQQSASDLRTVREFISSPAITAATDLLGLPILLSFLFYIAPLLGFMALIGLGVQLAVAIQAQRRIAPAMNEAGRSSAAATQFAQSATRNSSVIQAFGTLTNTCSLWLERQQRFVAHQAEASEEAATSSTTAKFVQTLQGSLLLGGACWVMLQEGAMASSGLLIVASTLGTRLLTPPSQLVAQWRNIVAAREAARRLDALLGETASDAPAITLPPPKGNLVVDNVSSVAPGSNRPILKGLRFSAKPGEALGVIGPSGCGKSTLAKVLLGASPVTTGTVRLDGADVHRWTQAGLGSHVGYVPQELDLFDGSIAENVARFGHVDRDLVNQALDLAGLTAFVSQLAQGVESEIGEDGVSLSGGIRQRLALARALYGNPSFVVMDEPDAYLDIEGMDILKAAIHSLKKAGACVVVITHRPDLIAMLDTLVLLHEGSVALAGPRAKVLEKLQERAATARQAGAAVAAASAQPGPAANVQTVGAP